MDLFMNYVKIEETLGILMDSSIDNARRT